MKAPAPIVDRDVKPANVPQTAAEAVHAVESARTYASESDLVEALDRAFQDEIERTAVVAHGQRRVGPAFAWDSRAVWDARMRYRYKLSLPGPDEAGVVEVARGLVLDGREQEAAELLVAQAPNRHAVTCATCGESVGAACRDIDADMTLPFAARPPTRTFRVGAVEISVRYGELLVPHAGRLG